MSDPLYGSSPEQLYSESPYQIEKEAAAFPTKYAIEVWRRQSAIHPAAALLTHLTRITMPLGAPSPRTGEGLQLDQTDYVVVDVQVAFNPHDDVHQSFA